MISGLDRKEWETQSKEKWDEFLKRFPYENLSSLTLENYCIGKGDQDNFCWWLEQGSKVLGSIWGGTCEKFLIYIPKDDPESFSISKKLPQDPTEAFNELKPFILRIAELSRKKDMDGLSSIESELFGPAVFWKIAFLYQDRQNPWIYPIFSVSAARSYFNNKVINKGSQTQNLLSEKFSGIDFWEAAYEINETLDNFLWIRAQDLAVEKGFEATGGKDGGRDETLKSQVFKHPGGLFFLVTKESKNLIIYTPVLSESLQEHLRNDKVDIYEYDSEEKRASYLNYESGLKKGQSILKLTFKELPSFERFLDSYISEDVSNKETDMQQSLDPAVNEILKLLQFKNNVIIQGAPGTGKTYIVPEVVTRLCGRTVSNRKEVINEFRNLQDEGRVTFCTFHPSFDYEDFVEGYKPVDQEESSGNQTLEVRPGVIRQICERIAAKEARPISDKIDFDGKSVWKVSLLGTGDNDLRTKCLNGNFIAIGFAEAGENISDWKDVKRGASSLKAFYERMKTGDFVVSCYHDTETDAIGVITGEPVWDENEKDYPRKRSVKWIYKKGKNEKPLNILGLNDGYALTLSTVYKLNRVSSERLRQFLVKEGKLKNDEIRPSSTSSDPFVLVIDEINRGNVAKIFGEVITLLESDKRKDQESEVAITLPYSHMEFRLPLNLYILATMNTADRSVGTLDYALRRRFAFYKAIPKKLDIPGFNEKLFNEVSSLFVKSIENPSEASEYLSPDYDPLDVWIGHSYFIETEDMPIGERFNYEILPILEEYLADGILLPRARQKIREIKGSLVVE